MTIFAVGQRVRIKWSKHWPELAGHEGTVQKTGHATAQEHVFGEGFYYWVAPDCWGSFEGPDGNYFAPRDYQLEPVQDDKQRSASQEETVPWEECMFSREGKYIGQEVIA